MSDFKHVFRDMDVSVHEINNYGVELVLDDCGSNAYLSLDKSDLIALLNHMGVEVVKKDG